MGVNQFAGTNDPEDEPVAQAQAQEGVKALDKSESLAGEEEASVEEKPLDDPMEEDPVSPATVFRIKLKQPKSNLQDKMSVPELCRNFRYVVRKKWLFLSSNLCVLVDEYS